MNNLIIDTYGAQNSRRILKFRIHKQFWLPLHNESKEAEWISIDINQKMFMSTALLLFLRVHFLDKNLYS